MSIGLSKQKMQHKIVTNKNLTAEVMQSHTDNHVAVGEEKDVVAPVLSTIIKLVTNYKKYELEQ